MEESVRFHGDDVEITGDCGFGDAYSLRYIQRKMRDPDPERAAYWARLWHGSWNIALQHARECNNRKLVHWMLDTGEPVPADIAAQLLSLKGRRGTPGATKIPEDYVEAVYRAIVNGHPYNKNKSNSPNTNPAFVEAGRRLHCSAGTVEKNWGKCPREIREIIRDDVEFLHSCIASTQAD